MKTFNIYGAIVLSPWIALLPVFLGAAKPIELDEIVITGESIESTARPKTKLKGDSLKSRASSTLGQTLSEEPGIQNASFGPGVGVPVIRGLTGSRVKTLSNNSGSHDVSNTSPDHAVTIEPLLAEEIEVLRGPAVVRYGSGALGGAVNVKDFRIPRDIPVDGWEGSTELRFGSNGAEKSGATRITVGKNNLAFHINGFRRTRNDMEIDGKAVDEDALRKQFGRTVDIVNTSGKVPNTDSSAGGFTFGGAFIGSNGIFGASFQQLDNEYGIPLGGHGVGTHVDPDGTVHGGPVRIDMDQSRIDARGEWNYQPLGILVELTEVDYQHSELESSRTGTIFDNETTEARLEASWNLPQLNGSIGFQGIERDFSAVGTEAFIPPSETVMGAAYIIQKLELWPFQLEASARAENQVTKPNNKFHRVNSLTTIALPDQFTFTPKSLAFALDWNVIETLKASFIINWAERAPDVQELMSVGPHLATRSYEVGSLSLNEESSRQIDFGLSYSKQRFAFKANTFINKIKDFIYLENQGFFYDSESALFQLNCGSLETCLPVFGYRQADAKMVGAEAEAKFHLIKDQEINLTWGIFTDVVRGKFRNSALGDLPRLPPWRYGTEIEASRNLTRGSIRWSRSEKQDRPGLNETETPAHHVLSVKLQHGWPWKQDRDVVVFLNGNNLLNNEIRNPVSFLRNFSPEPGRSIEIGLRLNF